MLDETVIATNEPALVSTQPEIVPSLATTEDNTHQKGINVPQMTLPPFETIKEEE